MPASKPKLEDRVARSLGKRRSALGLSLRALGARSGVSPSMISDVERGTKSPTLETLSALAQALDVSLTALMAEAEPPPRRIDVVRANQRAELVDSKSGALRDTYRPAISSSKIEFVRYVVPPHTIAGPFGAHARGTIEHMYLASGRLRIAFGADSADLAAGDCCTCLADVEHVFDNKAGGVEALLYIVVEVESSGARG